MSHQRTLSSWTVSVMAFAFGGLIGCAAQAADLPVAGYRGDGSGVFPGSPPTSFDEKTGQNIRWKAPLPNWGHGSPIAIAGKVLVTCEGGWKCDFPELLCFDADSGKELWRAELNHLPATGLPPEQQAAIAKRWAEVMARYRLLNQLWNDWSHATDKQKAIEKFNQETGWTFAAPTSGGYLENCKATDRAAWSEFLKPLAAAHLTLDSWYHCHGDGLACIGQTYPTPVSDGKQVWAVTAFGGVFCYDLAGKEVWKAYFPGIGAGDYCSRGKSPILYKDLLISDVDGLVRGMDAATGKLRWKGETGGRNYHTIASPAVITTGGQDVLLCGGKDTSDGKVSLHAFRLPDGQPLTVDGWSNCGATMLVKSDERDVAFFTGGGEHGGWEKKGNGPNPPPSAIKFALDGTALKATVV